MIAEVIINRTAKKLNRTFDYGIPQELEDLILIGSKVLVPFGKGRKLEQAFVVGIKEKSEFEVKDIAKIEDNLSDKQIELARWMAKRYFCNVSDCIKLMLTPGTRSKQAKVQDKTIQAVYLKKEIEEIEFAIEMGKIKSEKQQRVIHFIKTNEGATISEIEMFTDCSRAIVNTLVKNGYLEIMEKKIERNPLKDKEVKKSSNLCLTDEQQIAYQKVENAIKENRYQEFILYGVTGSGKTEIYLQLIQAVIEKEKTAIVLVPEISLTPQMLERFISRFGKEEIAVIHSKLSIGERYDEWNKMKEGKAKIVIGARSAIFSPVKNLGIIIMDEEHDSSYKSEANPKYDAKQVAKYMAKQNNCPLLLGSATPDMNTYYKATSSDEIELLELTKRANQSSLPDVTIVDLKRELANRKSIYVKYGVISVHGREFKAKKTNYIIFKPKRIFYFYYV